MSEITSQACKNAVEYEFEHGFFHIFPQKSQFFHIFPLVKSQFLRVKSLLEKIAIQLEMWPRLACGENRMM
jgi:hypothetical protein